MQRASQNPATAEVPPQSPTLFAGTSGWAYSTWKPGFYPARLPARDLLAFYATKLNSVEVNYTFRKLPSATMVQSWLDAVPAGFRFSFKAPQRITHMRRLLACEDLVKDFADAIDPVRKAGKLGVLLFQLPPNFKADVERLRAFLKLPVFRRRKLRIAFEFRHASWFCEDTYAALRERDAALCIAEGEGVDTPDVRTASFACYRLRKPGLYSPRQRTRVAQSIAAQEGDAFAYFRHEDQPTGPRNALALRRRLAVALAAQALAAAREAC